MEDIKKRIGVILMSIEYEKVQLFWDYLLFYPESDEEGYDGIHDGGIKDISDDAPEEAKKQFAEYLKAKEEAEKNGIKL